jgi:hypothetical protein
VPAEYVQEARVRLPEETGAWPAIRTWRDGDQEIDVFTLVRAPVRASRLRGSVQPCTHVQLYAVRVDELRDSNS